jgi:ParB family chromosome partitioning protein
MAKTGLGRGLGALLGGKKPAESPDPSSPSSPEATQQISAESAPSLEVEIGKIRPCPSQPRKNFDRQPLEELAESIKINGIIQPLVARQADDGQLELIAGERRWRAAQIAGLDTVPVIIRLADDAQVLELALVENLQREDLNPIEEAQGYALLIDAFNLTQEETAKRVGKSRTTITNAIRLLNLPAKTLDHLKAGRLTVGHAKVILSIVNADHQNLIAEKAIKDSLSVRQTEELIANLLKDSTNPGKGKSRANSTREVHVTSLENRLKEKLGTKVSLTYRDGKGLLTIKYFSDEDLERILKILDIES